MWLFWLLLFAALLCVGVIFAFPGAIPIVAIVVLVLCLVNAPLALRAARNRRREDDGTVRNWRGEVTDLGSFDEEGRFPRTSRAVFFGTPQFQRYIRERRRSGRKSPSA